MRYYFSLDGTTQQGPVDAAGLKAAGATRDTMVWAEGMGDWQPAGSVAELAAVFPACHQTPAGPPPVPSSAPRPAHLPHADYANHTPGTNGMAIASFVCGLVGLTGFCCCPAIIACVLAVIFGHIARGQIKRGYGTGDGFALAGLVMGYVGIVLGLTGWGINVSNHGFNSRGPNFNWQFGPKP